MVQATQAASNSLLTMLMPGTGGKKNTSDAVFSLGKGKADNSPGKAKRNVESDPMMALVAGAMVQNISVQDAPIEENDGSETIELAQDTGVVDNLEGTQLLSGDMLAAWLSQRVSEAQAGDEDAQAWLQALLARMPEGKEWNPETLAQFLNDNVALVQSAPYPLEIINMATDTQPEPAAPLVMQETADNEDVPETESGNVVLSAPEQADKAQPKTEPEAQPKAEAKVSAKPEVKTDTAKADNTAKTPQHAPHVPQAPFVQAEAPQAEPASVMQQNIASQVNDALVAAVNDGKDSLSIQMKPDFLGNLSIQLTMGKEGLVAKIRTESPEVQGAIAAQINELTAALRQKGVQVVSMDVVYSQMSQFRDMPQGRNGQAEQHNAAHVVQHVDAAEPVNGWLDTAMTGMDGNSVEYSA